MRTSERNVRLASAVLAFMPAACSSASLPPTGAPEVPCARGAAPLATRCWVERASTDRGEILTLRSPDGGFRRLMVTRDGRGVVAADGAEPAVVTMAGGDRIDVRIGDDRYELPATMRAAH